MMDFLISVWSGIKYLLGILGSVISFKLSFVLLLCIAYYVYKLLGFAFQKSSKDKMKAADKQTNS